MIQLQPTSKLRGQAEWASLAVCVHGVWRVCVCVCAVCVFEVRRGWRVGHPTLPLPLQVTILRPWLLQAPSAPTAPTAPAAAPAATALPGLDSAGAGVQAAATLSLVAKF